MWQSGGQKVIPSAVSTVGEGEGSSTVGSLPPRWSPGGRGFGQRAGGGRQEPDQSSIGRKITS